MLILTPHSFQTVSFLSTFNFCCRTTTCIINVVYVYTLCRLSKLNQNRNSFWFIFFPSSLSLALHKRNVFTFIDCKFELYSKSFDVDTINSFMVFACDKGMATAVCALVEIERTKKEKKKQHKMSIKSTTRYNGVLLVNGLACGFIMAWPRHFCFSEQQWLHYSIHTERRERNTKKKELTI